VIAAGLLWIPFTLLAAACQTARNAMQRELTTKLGTVGATHVRFLFGFPFALVFLAGVFMATGLPMPVLPWMFWPWAVVGAGAQILATALMLATMNDRSFVVTIAYIKTEAIQAAIFGLIFLGDPLTIGMVVAILVATAGVVIMSLKGKGAMEGGYRPVALGLFSGASTLKASRSSCTRVFRRSRDRAESLYASADSPRRASLPCDELLQSPRLSAASIDLLDDLALGAHLSARIIALPKLIEDVESALWLMRLGSNTVGHGKTG